MVNAAVMVQTGASDVVLAGGAESMSNVERTTTKLRTGVKSGPLELHDRLARSRVISCMIETAENCAKDWNTTREQCDATADLHTATLLRNEKVTPPVPRSADET